MAINRDKVLEAAQKFVEKKKYDKAALELRKLVEADPNDARTLLKIGDLQAKQGAYADAIGTYESVGRLYANQGFALKAIAVYKQIREIIAKHVPQLEERYGHIAPKLAELYQQLGLTSDALAALDEVATRLQRQQRDQEAIEVFRKIVELDPTNPLPHLRLAEALSRVKDVEGAVYEFKTAASQLAGIGRRDDALKVLERLLHHRPDPEQARICAELYLSRAQPQDGMQALAKLQICFQANPRDFDTLSLLARAFNAIGQGAKAIEVQKEMARVARDTGKMDLFREILERLLRIAPHDEGVRRLAQQQAPPPPPAPPEEPDEPEAPMPQEQPASAWQQRTETVGYPESPRGGIPRPATQPLRPAAPGAFAGHTEAYPADAEEEYEEIEEVSSSAYVEDLDDAELEEAEVSESDAYAATYEQPGESGEAYVVDENASFSEDEAVEYGVEGGTYEAGEASEESDDYRSADARSRYTAPDNDAPPPSDADLTEIVQKALADANSFRRVRLYAKALEALRTGLDVDPRSMDLHEVYRDVLIESGQNEEAVQEMLVIASLYVDALDTESAARALQDVLAFDPQNARAIDMLQELGYEIVDENEDAGAAEAGIDGGHAGGGAEGDLYGEAGPSDALPAYDLDEHGYESAHMRAGRGAGPDAAPPSYGSDHELAAGLPSFPLDEPGGHDAYADAESHLPSVRSMRADSPRAGATDPDELAPPPAVSAPPSVAISQRGATPSLAAAASAELEDALDEAEFFCSRGLFDDAKAILNEQLGKHPNNPLLKERLEEIDAQELQRGSGAREKPREKGAYDELSLDALESLDYGELEPAEGHAGEGEQVDVEEVFAKFKEGVAKQITPDDSESHYNLGIAYKEMMLLDDAIREFDVAAQDPKRECVCKSMIGMIHIERGNVNEAIEAFLQGLNAAVKDPQQETMLCFEVGAAYEVKKLSKEALTYYQKCMRRDPNYRDVQERVRRLAKAEPKQNIRQAAVGADDEFDRAFDGLLSKA